MSKWTPGPWRLGLPWAEPNGGFSLFHGDAHIADIYAGHHKDDEVTKEIGMANARLIAAAPEMAELLAEFVRASERPEYRENAAATLFCLAEEARALLARVSE